MPHRPLRTAVLLACLAALCGAIAPAAHAGAPDPLRATAAAHPDRRVEVIVQLDGSFAAGRAAVERRGGRVTGRVELIHALAARLRAADAVRLRQAAGVRAVTPNGRVRPQAVSTKRMEAAYPFAVAAPSAWTSSTAPTTGAGVAVAVIDTGIDGSLPDFRREDGSSRVIASAVTNPDATTARDTFGHGTHVAGILAGNGLLRDGDLRGQYIGVAPEADLVSIKVSDDAGAASVLDVIYGLQFAVDHAADLHIRVINLSVTSTTPGAARSDPLDAAAEAAWLSGIAVVAAAGNRGDAADAASYAPGNDPFVITVGAFDDRGTRSRSDDGLSSWSSRGTTQDGYAKPEVYAPGAHMVSTFATGSAFGTLCPQCVVSRAYFQAGGTSMAAPVVAGIAALVLQGHPEITPNQLKSLLTRTSRELPGGLAAVDAEAAVRYAGSSWLPSANRGIAVNGLVDPQTGAIDYTKSSWSRSSWSSSSPGLTADWARSSWSCVCGVSGDGGVDTTRSSWSRSSWSTSWDR